jgi:DNA repair exonuclease SbcCD ATPase subunit
MSKKNKNKSNSKGTSNSNPTSGAPPSSSSTASTVSPYTYSEAVGKNKNTTSKSSGKSSSSTASSSSSSSSSSSAAALTATAYLSRLDKDALCKQFDSLIKSSPEEGIQTVRDLYINVVKKKMRNHKRVLFLQETTRELKASEIEAKEQLAVEVAAMTKTATQKDKLQSLSDELNRKKEELLQEARVKAAEEKALQQARTNDLIAETQQISATLEKFNVMRQEYTEENIKLKDKLRVVLDKYANQEDTFNKEMEDKVSKIAAATAKLEAHYKRLENDSLGSDDVETKLAEAMKTDEKLRQELKEKSARFEEFQDALTKSNNSFKQFKHQMETKTNIVVSTEKLNKLLIQKKEKTEKSIRETTADIEAARKEALATTNKQVQKLTGLCSALKAEIAKLSE